MYVCIAVDTETPKYMYLTNLITQDLYLSNGVLMMYSIITSIKSRAHKGRMGWLGG